MMKKILLGLAAMALAGAVNAAPLTWTFGGGALAGNFDFDADLGTYSSVSFSEFHFGDNYSSATGTALSFFASSDVWGDFTSLSFLAPLTNLGGLISFTGTTQCYSACNTPNPNTFTGTVSAPLTDVPVPATLALFGLALAGLGWSRREKA